MLLSSLSWALVRSRHSSVQLLWGRDEIFLNLTWEATGLMGGEPEFNSKSSYHTSCFSRGTLLSCGPMFLCVKNKMAGLFASCSHMCDWSKSRGHWSMSTMLWWTAKRTATQQDRFLVHVWACLLYLHMCVRLCVHGASRLTPYIFGKLCFPYVKELLKVLH